MAAEDSGVWSLQSKSVHSAMPEGCLDRKEHCPKRRGMTNLLLMADAGAGRVSW